MTHTANILDFRTPILTPMEQRRRFVDRVCREHGVTWGEVTSPSRNEHLVKVRSIIAHRLKAAGWSLPRIARTINRDHTSVISLLRTRDVHGVYLGPER